MALTKNELQFVINCDVEEMVNLLKEDYGMSTLEAFDCVYNSETYQKLTNTRTGFYIESPLYIYSYLLEEKGLQPVYEEE